MKAVCDLKELSAVVAFAASIVPARSPRPILQHVMISAGPDGITVSATDLEVSVTATAKQADVEKPGKCLVPAARLASILHELDGEKVNISSTDNVATISAGGSRFKLPGEDPKEFPAIPAFDGKEMAQIGAAIFSSLIARSAFAAASEGTRYALNGVNFDIVADRIRLVATDGKRLALAEEKVAESGKLELASGVVPNKAVAVLRRLADSAEVIEFAFRGQIMFAKATSGTLVAQLVQGKFPPYEGVIPKDATKKAEIDRAALASAVRRASLLTTKDSNGVRFALGANKLVLSSRAPDIGESTIEMPVPYDGEPIEIAMAPDFVLDALKATNAEKISVEMKNAEAPALFRVGDGFQYVVMPISLG